jgi:hypothetical protein
MTADTAIRGRVMVWGDEPPRAQLPVRCLEDELLPAATPLPPAAPPSVDGQRRAASMAANRVGAEALSGATMCVGCGIYPAVAGDGLCSRPICQPNKPKPGWAARRRPIGRPCRGCTRHRALDDGFCGGGPCRAMAARLERLAAEGPPRTSGGRR